MSRLSDEADSEAQGVLAGSIVIALCLSIGLGIVASWWAADGSDIGVGVGFLTFPFFWIGSLFFWIKVASSVSRG